MSSLNRPDGVHFVMQPYRERIAIGKRSVMIQRIRLLSEQHGQYVLLSSLGQEAIEAIFSKESGYLLGETIWNYFQKPAYLIFCERLSKESNQVLLVIVRANEIYLDTLVDNEKLRTELVPLMTMQESFRIITCGDVSLSPIEEPGRFVLPKNIVQSFEVIKGQVFKSLPVLTNARLETLLLALKSRLLGSRISPTIIASSSALILSVVWWIYAVTPPREEVVIHKQEAPKADLAYLDFYRALKTPAPNQQLTELAQTIQKFYTLPGWQASTIAYDGLQYHIQLERMGGALEWLTQWAVNQNYGFNFSSKGAEVAVLSELSERPRPKAVYSLPQVMASLIDQLDLLSLNPSIMISDSKIFGQTKSRIVTINFTDVSPDTLVLIGDTLGSNLPLAISAINVNVRNGLLSGSVQLSVWGI